MTSIPTTDFDNLAKYVPNGDAYIVLCTNIPWSAHHDGTVILGKGYDGHIFLKINCHRNPEIYYIGDATGIEAPVFLKSFRESKEVIKIDLNMSQLVNVAMRRIQTQLMDSEIPEVSTIDNEHLAQRLIKYVVLQDNNLEGWIHMEQCRVKKLLEHYEFDNVQLIYPMVKTKENWPDEIVLGYNKLSPVCVPNIDIFKWIHDTVNNF